MDQQEFKKALKTLIIKASSEEKFLEQIVNISEQCEANTLCQSAGFDFTNEQLRHVLQLIQNYKQDTEERPLADDELDAVAGGGFPEKGESTNFRGLDTSREYEMT